MGYREKRSYLNTLTKAEKQEAVQFLFDAQCESKTSMEEWPLPFRHKPDKTCIFVWLFYDWSRFRKYLYFRRIFGANIPQKAYEAFWSEWNFSVIAVGKTASDISNNSWLAFSDAILRHRKATELDVLTTKKIC